MTRRHAAPFLAALALAGCASAPPAASSSRIRSLVLVETSGRSSETETFVSRFLLVLSDAGIGNVADARLAGAKLDILKDAASPEGARFRERYPGDGYLGLVLDSCGYAGRAKGISCTVNVVLLAQDGSELARFDASGSNTTLMTTADDKSAESEASREAAEKAAKKLLRALPH